MTSLDKRLKNIKVSAYGKEKSVAEILTSLNDEEITQIFSDLLETLLQSGKVR